MAQVGHIVDDQKRAKAKRSSWPSCMKDRNDERQDLARQLGIARIDANTLAQTMLKAGEIKRQARGIKQGGGTFSHGIRNPTVVTAVVAFGHFEIERPWPHP